jgi:hypothetical protein
VAFFWWHAIFDGITMYKACAMPGLKRDAFVINDGYAASYHYIFQEHCGGRKEKEIYHMIINRPYAATLFDFLEHHY